MSTNEAADQVVSMSLKGIEILAKISGIGAKNLATYLYAVLRDQKKTKGKTRLVNMLRSGKELKVFAVKRDDLKLFTEKAREYGVLYCALRDKKNIDGMVDIMVRAEDASKINRIVERFKFATVDTASIVNEIEKSRTEKAETVKSTPAEKSADAFVDELMKQPAPNKSQEASAVNENPTTARTETRSPSELTSTLFGKRGEDSVEPERKSVREELREIKAGLEKDRKSMPEKQTEKSLSPQVSTQSKPKRNKTKER